jgi:cytochrome c-type biogenesis protein
MGDRLASQALATMLDFTYQLALALGLGLLGFIEPCSIGAHLLFLKHIEGKAPAIKLRQTSIFAVTRGAFMGVLGAAAALMGHGFFAFQRGAWILLGASYTLIGALYLTGRVAWLMRRLGPSLARLSDARASATLGVIFGLNVPACAAPLLLVILATVAVQSGTSTEPLLFGFVILAVFGLALSAPLVILMVWPTAARLSDGLLRLDGARRPLIGLTLIGLGLWSIYFAGRPA